jgi:Cu/Ag efflux protein CusF
MKTIMKITALVLLAPLCANLTSCTDYGGDVTSEVTRSKDGLVAVDTYTNRATVVGIERKARKVKLKFDNGSYKTVKCGREVVNFPQIEVGDVVKVTLIDELAIQLSDHGKLGGKADETVALAVLGEKPGGVQATTVEITARIEAVDLQKRKVTLKFDDGTTQTLKVGPDIRLEKAKVGQTVSIRQTEAMALLVEKP